MYSSADYSKQRTLILKCETEGFSEDPNIPGEHDNSKPKENSQISGFQEFFEKSFFEGIVKITGRSSAEAILYHIKFKENSRNFLALHSGIESMLGKSGATIIEKSVIAEMFHLLDDKPPAVLNLANENFDFVRSVKYARTIYSERMD